MRTHLASIINRIGQSVTFTTGAQSLAVRVVVGTRRNDRDGRAGGYGNQSSHTLTALQADLTIAITPKVTTCNVGQNIWRVASSTVSQADIGVVVITLEPINP